MTFRYDAETDTLTVILGSQQFSPNGFESPDGDLVAWLDDGDSFVKLEITNVSQFIARAVTAGVKVEGVAAIEPPKDEMKWYSADSSMISGFGYNEKTGVLEIAFNKGVYRYFDVPLSVFEGLVSASSKGSYIRDYIIDMYRYTKK